MAGKSDKPGVFIYFVTGSDHRLKIANFFDLAYVAGSSARDLRGQKNMALLHNCIPSNQLETSARYIYIYCQARC